MVETSYNKNTVVLDSPYQNIKINNFKKFVNLLLLLCPILDTYGWGKFDFAFILTAIFSILYILRNGLRENKTPKFLVMYLVYWMLIHIISASTLISSIPLGCLRLLLVSIMFYECFEKETAINYYRIIATICIAFFYIQEISYAILGERILGVSQNLPLALDVESATAYYETFKSLSRSASFFSEPAHFAQFLLPLLAIELFNSKKLTDWINVVIIIITLLLLRSGNGILGMIIILSLFFIYTLFNKSIKSYYKIFFIVFLIMGIFGVTLYLQTENGHVIVERFEGIDNSASQGTDMSAYSRIYRGYYVFADYSSFEKIFGVDNPDIIKAHVSSSFVAKLFESDVMYFNSIQQILLRTGYVGLIIFCFMLIEILIKSDNVGKTVLLCFFGLMFISSNYFTSMTYIYLLISVPMITTKKTN